MCAGSGGWACGHALLRTPVGHVATNRSALGIHQYLLVSEFFWLLCEAGWPVFGSRAEKGHAAEVGEPVSVICKKGFRFGSLWSF